MSRYSTSHLVVGTTMDEPGKETGVVVGIGGLGQFTMNESSTRKLADDLLRNANYLWPINEEKAND